MSFQWIFDNAGLISATVQPTVAQSITRNNRVRAVARGGDSFRFSVQMPAGLPYADARPYIAAYEELGRITPGIITMPQSYISGYQGAGSTSTGWTATFAFGNTSPTVTGTGSAVFPTSEYKLFAAGDFIQPISAPQTERAYRVTQDVIIPAGGTPIGAAIPVNRIVNEVGTFQMRIGSGVQIKVIATKIPRWEIFDYNLVRWTGEFEFYEVLT